MTIDCPHFRSLDDTADGGKCVGGKYPGFPSYGVCLRCLGLTDVVIEIQSNDEKCNGCGNKVGTESPPPP